MKFSIVTVSFNSSKTIEATLRSVKEQTHPDIEHIVADSASSDGTPDIVRRISPSARLFVERDKGIFDGMNKGIAQATGDVIAILNSDDHYAHPDVLADIAKLFDETGADAVFADIAFFDPNKDR